jgi:2-(1,2-epoxy-1,2-dihydrophenyl)acetyl-CoA isomerase
VSTDKCLTVGRLVLVEWAGSIVILTLNRAERHNSLVPALLREMLEVLDRIEGDGAVRAVVLGANGPSFSTGGDLMGFYDRRHDLEAYAGSIVGLLNEVILAMVELPLPIVAAVQGIVTGGSLGLVLGCDVVLVAPGASFTPYYSVVGFSPDGGWTAMLPAIIGPKRAAKVLMCNRTITAEQAVEWGLASRIVPAEDIDKEALSVAQEIVAGKAGSIRQIKRLVNLSGSGLAARLEAERSQFVRQVATQEAREGIAAFLERRRG